MIVAVQDMRRLVVRVAAATIALRAVSMFSLDPTAREVAAMLPPPVVGGAGEIGHQLSAAFAAITGGMAPLARAPALLADLAVVLVVIAFARGAGWGTIAGLLGGAVAAMAPLGLGLAWRVDGGAAPLLGLIGLWQLRVGLRRGALQRSALSGAALAAAAALTPAALVLLPGALWMAWRSVAMTNVRTAAAGAWIGGAALGMGARVALVGQVAPLPPALRAWVGVDAAAPALDPLAMFGSAASAFTVGGPIGPWAQAAELGQAPLWRVAAGAALWLLAAIGLWRGLVREDPDQNEAPAADAGGFGGWRTLGVAVAVAPRALGERDWMPLLLPGIAAVCLAAVAAASGEAADLAADLAVDAVWIARPAMALLLGLGLAALGSRPGLLEAEPGPGARASVLRLIAMALAILGLGGMALLDGTAAVDGTAPRKVAHYAADELGSNGQAVLIGRAGLRVRWKLTGTNPSERLRVAGADLDTLQAPLDAAIAARAPTLVLAGDVAALGGMATAEAPDASRPVVAQACELRLGAAGYTLREDGHRALGGLAVRVYGLGDDAPAPGAIRPQIEPGVAP